VLHRRERNKPTTDAPDDGGFEIHIRRR